MRAHRRCLIHSGHFGVERIEEKTFMLDGLHLFSNVGSETIFLRSKRKGETS